jgi:hypothetical protein
MAGYTTIGELIESLKEQENLDAPVIYQYYLAEHFDTSEEVFSKVASEFESLIPCSDAYGTISDATRRLT